DGGGEPMAARALCRLSAREGNFAELGRALRRLAELSPEAEVASAYFHLASRVALARLHQSDQANLLCELAHRACPTEPGVLEDLIRLYGRERRDEELATALELWARGAEGPVKAERLRRAAAICRDRLLDEGRAILDLRE